MTSLPTLRRKILSSFSMVVALYAALGILLMMSVKIASKTTPKLLHVNYDSISSAYKMNTAWSALQYPGYDSSRTRDEWSKQFDQAINFELTNITEPGENEIAHGIFDHWAAAKEKLGHLSNSEFEETRHLLDQLITLNEKGMFGLAHGNEQLSRRVLIGAIFYFFVSLFLCLWFADNLSQRLSRPLKSIAEAIQGRQILSKRLKLPAPTNLELLVLTTELTRLWERLSEAEKVNISEVLKQKNKLETLLESVEDALMVLNADGTVSHCNACLLSLIGMENQNIVGLRWDDLSISNDNYLQLRSTLRPGMPEGQQVDLFWKGKLAYFSARSRKIETGEKDKTGVLYLIHDITEKKQREKFRSEFIDLLSHELKTPLQSLGTASELLTAQKGSFNEDQRLLVDTVADDVQRIKAVAQEFVQITQSHAKIMKLKMELVPINQLLPEWIRPFMVIAKDRKVKIEFIREKGQENTPIWANLDLVKFPWVVSNILSNAVRFSPNDGVVDVMLGQKDGAIEIRIRDLGPGIPAEEQTRMFEPFYQSPMATASGARGLFGIGLTIAKEVVESHDGRIEYSRLEPHGSEFKILLPVPLDQYTGETKSWTH